jgi:hypothetical protein
MTAKYSVRASRRLLALAAAGALAGIALSTTGTPGGPMLTVGSLLTLIVALHRFGRTGPDAGQRRIRRRKSHRRAPP